MAAYDGLEQIVEILLEKGANIEEINKDKISLFALSYETPLYNAVFKENTQITAMLLEKGASPNNIKDKYGIPLHEACKNGNKEIIELLLKYKADIEAKDKRDIYCFILTKLL